MASRLYCLASFARANLPAVAPFSASTRISKFFLVLVVTVHEGETAPEKCPQCGVPGAKFKEQGADMTWA